MAVAACARSVFRSGTGTFRNAASNLKPSPFRFSKSPAASSSRFLLRSPVEIRSCCFCVESLLPLHTATSSALLTSMLAVSRRSYCWLSQGQDETT